MAFLKDQQQSAFIFGIIGNMVSFLVYLAPVKVFYKVYKKKSAEGFKSLPYLVALLSSMVWLYYALLKPNCMLLITVNSFGCVVEIIYITIFVVYAPPDAKKLTMKLFGIMDVGIIAAIIAITRFAVPHAYQVQVVGWVGVVVSVSVFAAPFTIVAQVVKTRSVEFMPFTLSFLLTLSAVMWFAYGIFLKDICIAIPNVVGFVLGLIQMILYAIYKNIKTEVNLESADKNNKTEVNIESADKKIRRASSDQIYPVIVKEDHDTPVEIVLADLRPTHASAA